MILARDFRLDDHGTHVEASCAVQGEGFPDRMTFRLPADHAPAVDIDEPNWAAMALYWTAMMTGQDLVIEADLSPLLLYNMRNDLMALMRNYEPLLKPIRIEAGFATPRIPDGPRDVMTGFSGGVDSFSTFVLHTRPDVPPSLRMTALAVFQVGALGPTATGDTLLIPALEHARAQARDHGLKTYGLSSNMDMMFEPAKTHGPADFRRTVGLRNAAAALLLQNGVRQYLPSGTVAYNKASYGPYACTEPLDPVLQPLLSSEKLRVQPAGAGLSRVDKIRLLADDPQAQQRLNVCVSPAGKPRPTSTLNCTACWKCLQTVLVLEMMGKADDFAAVFDIPFYRRNRDRLLQRFVDEAYSRDYLTSIDQIEHAKAHGVDVPKPRRPLELQVRRVARELLGRAPRAWR